MKTLFLLLLFLQMSFAFAQAEEDLKSGIAAHSQGDYNSAIKILTLYIKENPKNDVAHVIRGDSYSKLNKYKKAEADFTSAIQIKPSSENYFNRGYFYYMSTQSDVKSKVDLLKAFTLDNNNVAAIKVLGYVYCLLDDLDSAYHFFNLLENQDDMSATYNSCMKSYFIKKRDLTNAKYNLIEYVEKINVDINDSIFVNTLWGNLYFDFMMYDSSCFYYERVLQNVTPTYTHPYVSLADINNHLTKAYVSLLTQSEKNLNRYAHYSERVIKYKGYEQLNDDSLYTIAENLISINEFRLAISYFSTIRKYETNVDILEKIAMCFSSYGNIEGYCKFARMAKLKGSSAKFNMSKCD